VPCVTWKLSTSKHFSLACLKEEFTISCYDSCSSVLVLVDTKVLQCLLSILSGFHEVCIGHPICKYCNLELVRTNVVRCLPTETSVAMTRAAELSTMTLHYYAPASN
jgi:hypothetical protein